MLIGLVFGEFCSKTYKMWSENTLRCNVRLLILPKSESVSDKCVNKFFWLAIEYLSILHSEYDLYTMRRFSIVFLCPAIAVALVTGCGVNEEKTQQCDVEITQFPVREVIMTADRYYCGKSESDTVYLDRYVSLLWPEDLGDTDVKVLQDSLLRYCFGDSVSATPVQAIERYVCDTSDLDGEYGPGYDVTPVDSLPVSIGGLGCYFENVIASVIDLNEEIVTYRVLTSYYMGGAHPMTAIHPFTYDLDNRRVLSLDDILTPEGVDSIMPVIRNALARQLDEPVDKLRRAGIFVSQFNYPGYPYIANNTLYFHYNPYEIAPYSSGMIDVAVYPYEVDLYLRPEVRRLFDLGK